MKGVVPSLYSIVIKVMFSIIIISKHWKNYHNDTIITIQNIQSYAEEMYDRFTESFGHCKIENVIMRLI